MDLAGTFIDQWRFPLTDREKKALENVKWDAGTLTVSALHDLLK
ncbi:MAG: hypothetical protein QNL33_01180 [Akkermansiaceae bacterium]|jgi:hypothetical protein